MKSAKLWYNIINIGVIAVSVALFICIYREIVLIFQGMGAIQVAIIVATAILVHLIKAGRLFLALYGSWLPFNVFLKTYSKVTPVSMIIPFKLGEFFRMYCYGKELNNYLKGIIIIILDRFMDTVALLTMILLVWIFNGVHISSIIYILLIFLIFVVVLYFVFPGVYAFWKKYFLRARATKGKLAMLRFLEGLNKVYLEIKAVTKGRGIILYIMSLVAWAAEIGNIAIQNSLSKGKETGKALSDYLSSVMGGGDSVELKQFIFISVIIMVVVYVITKIWITASRRKVKS